MGEVERVPIAKIRTDGGTQSREKLNDDAIAEYTEAYSARNNAMPPVVVFHDGTDYWLADGFHRVRAATAAGKSSIRADVRQGTQRDAILFSVGANSSHGLRRTNADKRRAVLLLLRDEEWSKRSDRWIAERCGVSHPFVTGLRPTQVVTVTTSSRTTRTGQDGKTYSLPARGIARPPEPKTATTLFQAEEPVQATVRVVATALREVAAPARVVPIADVIPLHGNDADAELAAESALLDGFATDEARDSFSALRDLDEDIERHIKDWTWPPGGLVAALEGWARRAKIILAERDERTGHG